MDGWKTWGKHLDASEVVFNKTTHDSQQMTESSSSSSNSSSVILPFPFSNPSYQLNYSFRNHGGSLDNSISTGFDCRFKEPGVTAQIANARVAWNGLKISSQVVREVSELSDMYKWDSPTLASTIGKSSVYSDNSDNFNCSNQAGEHNIRSCGNHPTSHSGERMMSSEITGETELGPEVMMDKIKDDFRGIESSESSTTKPIKVAANDQDIFFAPFDLNEDINGNVRDNLIQPVLASHSVIHVLAKAAMPRGLPEIPLKFEGGLGWKGSAETSAFRPAALSNTSDSSRKYIPREPRGFTDIDLNVAAVEEEMSSAPTLQDSHSRGGSKRAENLNIDLNCLYDAGDGEFTQLSLPSKSENPSLMDLNLNVNTLTEDTSNGVHWLKQGWQSANPGKQDLIDLTMQQIPHHGHAQQWPVALMQRAALLQPRLPYIPSHGYPPKHPVYFTSKNPLPSYIHNSATRPHYLYPNGHGIFPELLNPEKVHTSLEASRLLQLDVKTNDNLSTSGSKMDQSRQSMFLAHNGPMDEHAKSLHQAWYAMSSTKRKEPEGGFDHYQLGYRQMI